MNEVEVSADELAEDRRTVQGFMDAGVPEYWACMFTAQMKQAAS